MRKPRRVFSGGRISLHLTILAQITRWDKIRSSTLLLRSSTPTDFGDRREKEAFLFSDQKAVAEENKGPNGLKKKLIESRYFQQRYLSIFQLKEVRTYEIRKKSQKLLQKKWQNKRKNIYF